MLINQHVNCRAHIVIWQECVCREVSIERLKSELASSHEQLDSQTQQVDSLKSSFTQQTAELHKAQSSVNQLQNQVHVS